MNRIKKFLLCLVLLALVAIVHHLWLGASGTSGIVLPAEAATLSNGVGDRCTGTGTWHFVNPQNGGDCEPLTVTFNCGGTTVTASPAINQCNTNLTNYATIQTSGDCTLISAVNTAPGKIVLSSLVCAAATPTPTPTPIPTPSPV
jgi:hypothetical protein